MKTFKRVLLAVLAILPAVAATIAVLFYLPERAAVHFDFSGNVDRYGSKLEAYIFPGVLLTMYAIYLIVRSVAKKSSEDREKAEKNLDIIETVFIAMFAMLNALFFVVLIAMKEPATLAGGARLLTVIMGTGMGILLIIIGNIIPKSRRNHLVGMRLSFAMDTDEHWYITNRNGGIALVISGLATVAAGVIFRDVIGLVVTMLGSIILTGAIAIIVSYVKIKRGK